MIAFLDTNVLVDVLQQREPFYVHSAEVWALAERGAIRGIVSALSLPNVFYVLRRTQGREVARQAIIRLRDVFGLAPVDEQIVQLAIDAEFGDFEDAIQFFCALRCGADVLVTRNTTEFPRQDLAILTPTEFLAAHFPE